MRPNVEASYEGIPLRGLRGLSADFFAEIDYPPESQYFLEDENIGRPVPSFPSSVPSITHTIGDLPNLNLHKLPETKRLGNETLPIFIYKDKIIQAVKENQVTIIVAETGAGKSTQVPQFLLDGGWDNIYLTQPRRAAARNVFERIREEIGSVRGEYEAGNLVSYQTAGEHEGPKDARIKVVTDGLQLVREFRNTGMEENDVLIIDEVHEGNANVEALLAWAKLAIAQNPRLRVVIKSATMDSERTADYFNDVCVNRPPIIEVPGRNYKVEVSHKPESTAVLETVKAAESLHAAHVPGSDEPNAILVFEPGKREINDTIDEIRRKLPPEIAKTATILPFHAKLSVTEQQAVFRKYPGVTIIVSTNLAQTSLTLPNVKYVIDTGYERRMELDQHGAQGLVLNPISQADCEQRKGRAGRVSDGFYVLTRLDAKTPYIPFDERDEYPTAEILRTDIVRNTLRFAGIGLNLADVGLYHPVEQGVILRAQASLRTLGALDDYNNITPLGKRMDQFPVCAPSARMMVEAARFSEQTRTYMAAIVAAKEAGGLQYFAYNVPRRWKELTDEKSSDLLAQLDLFIAAQSMDEKQMREEFDLDTHNIERAREQYRKIATRVNAFQEVLPPPTAEERKDIISCISAGLINSIYKRTSAGEYIHISNAETPREISNRSQVIGKPPVVVADAYRVEFMSAGERVVKHILEHVTTVSLVDLGRIAMDMTAWTSDGFVMRNGKFVERRRQSLFGIDLGLIEETTAEPSPKLREEIIAHALQKAGPQQIRLRAIKRELEVLAHLAKDPVTQLTHNQVEALVRESAPEDITDPSVIDNNLRVLMQERNISLDSFIAVERQDRIRANAPSEIVIDDLLLHIEYRNSRPLVKSYKLQDIAKLHDEVFLHDGRQVYFIYGEGGKRCSLMELQEKLGINVFA